MTQGGLRERKKQKTREAIRAAALRLFAQRGYEQTTIADIAAAADVAPRTFFSYFPAKEDVVFAPYDEVLAQLEERVAERSEAETAIDALRAWIEAMDDENPLDPPEERLIGRLAREHGALAARRLRLLDRLEATLAYEVRRDLGDRSDPLQARMVAAAAVAVLAALDPAGGEAASEADDEAKRRMLDDAFTFLDAGLAAWRAGR